jgi:flagellin
VDYQISDLYNEGFNTTCATCTTRFYSISFTDNGATTNKDGIRYNLVNDSNYPRLEVDISDCTDGDDIVLHIISAVDSCPYFENHYTQYAYNDVESGKLYVYDNRTWQTGGGSSSFEPSYRRTDGTLSIQSEKTVTNPTTGEVTHYQDKDLWIQTGANANQGIWLNKPWINNATLGIDGLSVMSYESANATNSVVERALLMVSAERSRMGAFSNRFEHVVKVDDNTAENLQDSESKIRDTDMASEMVGYSKNNILQQVGQSVLAQANQSQSQVLSLLE